MKMLKGFLIDPALRTITEVQVRSTQSLDHVYELTGCDCVDFVYLDNAAKRRTVLIVDDEGLLKGGQKFFKYRGPHGIATSPLAGKAVVMGLTDGEGELCSCPLTLQQVTANVIWPTTESVRNFRDAGGFDTRITGFGDEGTTIIPVRPDVED